MTGIVFAQPHHIAFIAIERYIFFCHPLKYINIITGKTVTATLISIYMVSFIYTITLEAVIGRTYHTSVMSCQLPQSTLRLGIHFALVYLIPAIEVIIIIIVIRRLNKRASVAPALPANYNANAEGSVNGADQILLQQMARNVRMILLISGAFWGTTLPASLISTIVHSTGGTWAELDARVYPIQSHLLKMCSYLVSLVSSFLNPIIYYWSRRDLRDAFKTRLRIFRQNI